MTHICVGNLTIIGSDNGLSPHRCQDIIWTNAGILLIEPLGTNFSDNLIKILTFSFTKMLLKVSSAKWRPFCLGLDVLRQADWVTGAHCLAHTGRVGLAKIKARVMNGLVVNWCPNCNSGLVEFSLNLGHKYVMTSHNFNIGVITYPCPD